MTKRIIQKDTWSCFACCAAMITGETVEDVYKFIGHDGSDFDEKSVHPEKRRAFDWVEIIKYLLEHRYTLGTWSMLDKLTSIDEYDKIQFDVPIKNNPMLLEVPSKRLGDKCTHIIYWDGKRLFDPSPEASNKVYLKDYKVLQAIPVLHFETNI